MSQLNLMSLRRSVPHAWIEPFAGSLAVALHILGGEAPIGYAGNKRYPAPRIMNFLWPYNGSPDRIVVADVGPWRTVWEVFAARGGGRILDIMLSWPGVDDRQLWHDLTQQVPNSPEEFAATYLFVQARQAHHAPIWVRSNGDLWVSRGNGGKGESHPNHRPADWRVGGGNGGSSAPGHTHSSEWVRDNGRPHLTPQNGTWARAGRREGQETEVSHRSYGDGLWTRAGASGGESAPSHRPLREWSRGSWTGTESGSGLPDGVPTSSRWGGALSRATLIQRIRGLIHLPWDRVQVLGDYRAALAEARAGDVVYQDPPYVGASIRYAAPPPDDIEERSLETAERGVHVAISEARPMPRLIAAGWEARDITAWFRGKREPGSEWITVNELKKELQ